MEHASKRGLAPVQPESAGASPHVDRSAIEENSVRSAITKTDDRGTLAASASEHASQYCPVCSQRLESRRCKLICPLCGYYMSCADYY